MRRQLSHHNRNRQRVREQFARAEHYRVIAESLANDNERLRAALSDLYETDGALVQWIANRVRHAGWEQFKLGENPHHDAWLAARAQARTSLAGENLRDTSVSEPGGVGDGPQ